MTGTPSSVPAIEETPCAKDRQQAHTMEAVGRLAGGIAHDLNNLLMVISGTLEFVREDVAGNERVADDLSQISDAADRARDLVRQLLVFSRGRPTHATQVRLSDLVRDAEAWLREMIGPDIALTISVAPDEPLVHVDPGQLEHALMNLALNARDAMLTAQHGPHGSGGTLTLHIDTIVRAALHTPVWGRLPGGMWVRLRVQDTGHGMDEHTQTHAFEPFFTTKDVGQGTGLGLATVFGIVRQAGGAIRIDSTPGAGTTFTILLPAVSQPDPLPHPVVPFTPQQASSPGAGLTVLLVDDDADVRRVIGRMLAELGCQVLVAEDGPGALRLWPTARGDVQLVVTDVRMPHMSGPELVSALRADRPSLPVIFVTGYAERAEPSPDARALRLPTARPDEWLLAKPFTIHQLAELLKAVVPR